MRTLFFNIACILTLFDIGAPINEKLEANYNEEHLLRYVMISPYLFFFCDPGSMVPSVFLNLVTDVCLKETSTIQVHDKTSLRCQLEVDEVHASCDGSLIGGAV